DRPATDNVANHVPPRTPRRAEQRLVEVRVTVHLPQRSHLDARLLHGNREARDALVLGLVPVRASEQQAQLRVMRARVPHLLSTDDPLVTVSLGARRETGQVRAAARLAEQLTPHVLAR